MGIKKLKRKIKGILPAHREALSQSPPCDLSTPILIGTHHKTGSVWMKNLFRTISREVGLRFWDVRLPVPDGNVDIFMDDHSKFEKAELPTGEFRGIHVIRDPRDVIVSGCFFHQKSDEAWLHVPKEKYDGLTYQEKINSLDSPEDQLFFEMDHVGAMTIGQMMSWDYTQPQFFEVRYRDLIQDEDLMIFHRMFLHLGFEGAQIPTLLQLSFDNSLFGGLRKSRHVRSGKSSQWKQHFTPAVKDRFKEKFPGVLVELGYEDHEDW